MYGPNPWGYPPQPQPQYIYVPVPQQPAPGGVQTITSAEEARKLYRDMRKMERKWKKEQEATKKEKEGDKKPDDKKKSRIDDYFATKAEVIFFMCLIALPIGFAEALLVRALLARLV